MHGQERRAYASSGDVYEGQWVNDEKDGQGVLIYASGETCHYTVVQTL